MLTKCSNKKDHQAKFKEIQEAYKSSPTRKRGHVRSLYYVGDAAANPRGSGRTPGSTGEASTMSLVISRMCSMCFSEEAGL